MYYNPTTNEQLSHNELQDLLNASIPARYENVNDEWFFLHEAEYPSVDKKHKVVSGEIKLVDGKYTQTYDIVDLSKDEILAIENEEKAMALQEAKRLRSQAVNQIIVEQDGMKFDGNEVAQERMARLVLANFDNQDAKVDWVLADNTVANVYVWQIKLALASAIAKQGELWVAPYINMPDTLTEEETAVEETKTENGAEADASVEATAENNVETQTEVEQTETDVEDTEEKSDISEAEVTEATQETPTESNTDMETESVAEAEADTDAKEETEARVETDAAAGGENKSQESIDIPVV